MQIIWLAFITGLTTGGLTCLAVQGGLLASAVDQKERISTKVLVGTFLLTKLFAYTLLGVGLGSLGSVLTLSSTTQGWMQIAAGLYMLATAARLLDLHPIFRYTTLQPPKWAHRAARKITKNESLFTPGLLGFMTVFIPCGVTQAMMVLAISSGSPLIGAGIMFAFTLGTSPIFFALGASAVSLIQRKSFALAAAVLITVLGIGSVNSGQALRGSIHTLQNYWLAATTDILAVQAQGARARINQDGKQEVTISVTDRGYSTQVNTLKAGIPVKLTLITNNVQGCTRAFTIPSLSVSRVLPQTGTETLEFTPKQAGRLSYTCSMGMFTGSFQVI